MCHRRGNEDRAQRRALPVAQVERRAADCSRAITLTPERRAQIEEIALARLRRQRKAANERLNQLDQETTTVEHHRRKLLEAYYADAIPRSLFVSEQRRLKTEQTRLDHDRKAATADQTELEQQTQEALNLLQDAHTAYLEATPAIRKQLNRALFARILLGAEPHNIRIELNEPYRALVHPRTDTDGIK